MDFAQARKLIANIFENQFYKVDFTEFVSNLLNSANFSNSSFQQGNQIAEQYKDQIKSLERLASYSDSDDNKVDVLIVTLLKDTSLERARTLQRNYVAAYLNKSFKDAALVAFVYPGSPDWRFSLIRMESRFEGTKVIEEFTPAKRWSFLVGKNEGSHTAQSQLLDILANDNEDPTLDELIEAFSIETVTKEFYQKYRELFDRMTEDLEELIAEDQDIKIDFENKEIDPRDFARKTMGQISFLYFLQKKGWFGVRPGEEWGTGVKNFVRKLFERREAYGGNFFNDVLEPLFYEALALDRGNDAIYPRLNNVRMPFLNGGLFEPLNGYSWKTTDITLPDELFSNKNSTKEGDTGDGILDIFDRYNFTVNESEPLEMEVAVDPEMLGMVFENLIPENIRKGKGAYYTPRPIVNYMCQESLINYLDTELSSLVLKEEIEVFIRDESGQMDLTEELKNHAQQIDELLANIKVCDPAVGSGAFPLGILNQIVKLRRKIGKFLNSNLSDYDFKLHAISNSIYGVDYDPGAVEIAKLRFWLSLVVEEDTPSPLPNLDHKIMQGNSLISEYEGIKLFDDDFLHDAESKEAKINEIESTISSLQQKHFSLLDKGEYTNTIKAELDQQIKPLLKKLKSLKNQNSQHIETEGLFEEEQPKKIAQQKANTLQAKVAQHISTHSQSDKERLKKEIEDLKWDLIETTLEENGEEYKLNEIKNLRRDRTKPFFIWKLEFGDVFKNNGGFDVVIANPPYIQLQKRLNEDLPEKYGDLYEHLEYETFKRTGDIYALFYELGVNVLKTNGHLTYITSNKWMRTGYGDVLRGFFVKFNPKHLLDFSGFKVFTSAAVDVNIIVVSKSKNQNKLTASHFKNDYRKGDNISRYFERTKVELSDLNSDTWFVGSKSDLSLKHKVEQMGTPIKDWDVKINYGIKTGYNKAFIITDAKRNELINQDPRSAEVIKPVLGGKNLIRYHYIHSGLYLLFIPWHFPLHKNPSITGASKVAEEAFENQYPAIYYYLLEHKEKLSSRNVSETGIRYEWYALQRCASTYYPEFAKEKMVWLNLNRKWKFSFVDPNILVEASLNFLSGDKNIKTIVGVMSSKLQLWYFKTVGRMHDNGGFMCKVDTISNSPIPIITESNQHLSKRIEELVEFKINNSGSDNPNVEIEQEIDQLVYELYELTEEEIEIIENSTQ